MAKVFIEETTLTAIGDAIRGKEGSSGLVPVTEMASRITNLPSGGGGSTTLKTCAIDCTFFNKSGDGECAAEYVIYSTVENGTVCNKVEYIWGAWEKDRPTGTGMNDFNYLKTINAVVGTPFCIFSQGMMIKSYETSDNINLEALGMWEDSFFMTTVPDAETGFIIGTLSY